MKKNVREYKVLKNIFKTNYSKKVLISYTIYPFLYKNNDHANIEESRCIAKIFDELGYDVDICHYTSLRIINYNSYDVMFGFGEPFENSFIEKNIKRIYYATGAHVCHQNYAEIKRVESVNKKYNADLLPKRLVPWTWSKSTSLSDCLIVIGNEWTKSTYEKYTLSQVIPINATALINNSSQYLKRDIKQTKTNFLWFGSRGLVHKGLDLCLEYFESNKNITLHICGPVEKDFFDLFENVLSQKNIIQHGFVEVGSQKFIDITSQCSFSILPSCSEGQATGLLTAMGTGLIPIASKYSGVDVEEYGILIDKINSASLGKSISSALQLKDDEISNLSIVVQKYVNRQHNITIFKKKLKDIIKEALDD
ncbi:MAG: glycosyltransferase [Bacteroidales bacterium]|nr:glycosyltransferase [Bacteroidales bacterium]